ncbi:SDR family NAD(P)-dependent oxidoreductase [Cognaticolwellia beringensis]|uniref:NAD(P)-dependent oxidoreductase n=1 Tax=Cognaticolwellia beringensis TaxID=1967665 RepID=A0A222G8Q9_9GAMM|nr:SDR family oxidoreductase [Cognaticolwellia beringensis]ASP48285.1 NAD(P)-dependent oxidoreductase [Cognaticolwellia beringensis]
MHIFDNKIIIVTGAGQGIGQGVSRRFARAGGTVIVADINVDAGQQTANSLQALGGKGYYIPYDLFDVNGGEKLVDQVVAQFGQVDVLVNNAYPTGLIPPGPIESKPMDGYYKTMQAGFFAIVNIMNAVFPHMKERQFGRIINMCSLNGVNAHKYTAEYNASKEAVRAFSRTAAVEWMQHGITTNIICPGAMSEAAKRFMEKEPEMMAEMLSQNPAGRMGDPEQDIGGATLLLASDDAQYINGNTIFVDGGSHINGVNWSPKNK